MSISRHATYNLLGAVVPLAITVATVPLYLALVGTERYGVLAICWAVLGYVSFLDLGLGPAVAQRIAAMVEDSGRRRIALFWTAIWMSLALGAVGALLLYGGTRLYFEEAASLSGAFRAELRDALPLLASLVPIAMVSGVLTGALQGRERFLAINLASGTGASLMTLLPLAAAWLIAPDLHSLIAGAVLARLLTLVLLYAACRRALGLGGVGLPAATEAGPLLRFGGWVTLTTMSAPLLLTSDRLFIGATLGAAAVAVYAIPYNLVARLGIIPTSLASALFPRFAYADPGERRRLLRASSASVAVIVTPAAIVGMALVPPFFDLWIGHELSRQATPVAYVLILGAWANSFGQSPFVMIQGSGRPDLVSKLLMAEIVPYWGLLFAGMWVWGLVGAAAAWSVRAAVDTLILFRLARVDSATLRPLALPALLVGAASLAAAGLDGPGRYAAMALIAAAAAGWSLFNVPDVMRSRLGRFAPLLPRARAAGGEGA